MGKQSYPPTGRLIDAGGHRLHIHALGEGSPTVVFEAGGLGWSMDWYQVQQRTAQFTRAVVYDRAGFGWSDPGPLPRTSGQIARELRALLDGAGEPGPYLLVGASFGGHMARLFAAANPAETAGVVLVDARHEDLNARMPPAWAALEQSGRQANQAMLALARAGLLSLIGRLLGARALPPGVKQVPPELHPVYLAAGYHPAYFQANLDELAAVAESDAQVRAAGGLGSLPLTVIRHGKPEMFARMPAAQAAQAEQAWQSLQADLARLSTCGRLVVAESSGHAVAFDQPGLVVEAIREVVNEARSR